MLKNPPFLEGVTPMADFLIVKNHNFCHCCFEAPVKMCFFLLLFQVDFHNLFGSAGNVIVLSNRSARYVQ